MREKRLENELGQLSDETKGGREVILENDEGMNVRRAKDCLRVR